MRLRLAILGIGAAAALACVRWAVKAYRRVGEGAAALLHRAALQRAEAHREARGEAFSPVYHHLLEQLPYDSERLRIRMLQPDTFERLSLRHAQRDPAKGCIDPDLIGTPEGRDVAEISLALPDGERVFRMFAFTAHLVRAETLWDPEAAEISDGGAIYEGGTATGTLLWDSAVHTTEWLLGLRLSLAGRSVLELGCGLGLPGLACHALGAANVLLTDRPPIAELVADGLAHSATGPAVRSFSFEWDAAGAARVLEELGGPPDVLLACDCIFAPLFGDAFLLLQMLDLLAGPNTVALVALERRQGDGAERFFECACEAGFAVSPPRLEQGAVVLFELTRGARWLGGLD